MCDVGGRLCLWESQSHHPWVLAGSLTCSASHKCLPWSVIIFNCSRGASYNWSSHQSRSSVLPQRSLGKSIKFSSLLWQPAGGVCLALSRVTVPVCSCRGSVEHLQSLCKPNVPKVRKGFHAVGQASTLSQKALDSQILSNAKIVVTTINSMHIPPCSRKYYIGTLWSWATDLASLKLGFLICNLGAKSSFHCFENEMIWPYQLRLFLSQAIETQSVSCQAERAINYK